MHKPKASKLEHRTKFGIYAPTWLVNRVDEIRETQRTDLDSRSAAVVEAMEQWVEREAGKAPRLTRGADKRAA